MPAPVSVPDQQTERRGRLWWLPGNGRGNGLDDDAWAPVLEVSHQAVPALLEILREADSPAYARRRIAGASVSFAALAVLAVQAGGDNEVTHADRALFDSVRARRGRAGIAIARRFSAFAEPPVIYPLLTIAGISAVPRTGWRQACVPCLVVASGAMARRKASRLIARPRPPAEAWLTVPEGYSLPSKHTTLAVLTAGACMRAFGIGRPATLAVPLLAAAGVGASRVYLGVHWPADVIAGWLFADGWLRLADSLTDCIS